MKSSTKVVLDKINELDSQALNSLRLVIILSLALVFGVILYRQMFNGVPPVQQAVALANPQVGAGLTIKNEPVISAENQSAVAPQPAEPVAALVQILAVEQLAVSLSAPSLSMVSNPADSPHRSCK